MDTNQKIERYQDLKIWQRSIKLVGQIYKITKVFPNDERFGLISQIRRSAISIPSNIAEGFGRWGNKEYRHFLYISLGSCAELTTQLVISFNLGYISENEKNELVDETDQISKMTTGLIKKIDETF
ncbi:MAG: four helix bundle protein [Sedimentisphaerales bacterium]